MFQLCVLLLIVTLDGSASVFQITKMGKMNDCIFRLRHGKILPDPPIRLCDILMTLFILNGCKYSICPLYTHLVTTDPQSVPTENRVIPKNSAPIPRAK